MFLSSRVATLVGLLLIVGCSGDSERSGDNAFELGVTTKVYPFLAHNEIALDLEILNTTDAVILISNMPSDGNYVVDGLSWLGATYRDGTGDYPLTLERRTSEISRYRDIYNEGDLLVPQYEFMPIGPGFDFGYKLIAVADRSLALGSNGEIQVFFQGPINHLGVQVDDLKLEETFMGPTLVVDEYRNLDFQPARFESAWAHVPTRY